MIRKNPIQLEPLIYLWIKTPEKKPLALSLETKKFLVLASFVTVAGILSVVGSLLFFRELEINHRLGKELLALRLKEKMAAHSENATPIPAVVTPIAPSAPVTQTKAETPAKKEALDSSVMARLTDLSVECTEGVCATRVSMVPAKAGVAEGTLLLVLETEVLRIGSSTTGQQRKRFFFYPTAEPRDTFEEKALSSLKKKSFHFSRALQTSASFSVGNLVRPLALNLYILDPADTVVHHERKTIEGNGSDAE